MADLELTREIVERLFAEADRASPDEACGLLLGVGTRIDAVRPTRNVHPDARRRFEIDPKALIAAHREARGGGAHVIGYYHSHPSGPAEPSATDRDAAAGDAKIWAIVGQGEIRWWIDAPTGFAELSTRFANV